MSIKKNSKFNILKYTLLFLFVFLSFSVGEIKVDAASTNWTYGGGAGMYNASTNKDNYTVGETVTVSGGATRPSGDSQNIGVGVGASLNGVDKNICDANNNCTGTVYFTAPSSPGTHSISLLGCWYTGSQCAWSSLSINVSCPSGQSWNGSSCVTLPNGQCGSSYGTCAAGTVGWTATYYSGSSGVADWWCVKNIALGGGGNSGDVLCRKTASCNGSYAAVNGQPGVTFPSNYSSYPYAQCTGSSGTYSDNTNFPPQGSGAAWLCHLNDEAITSRMCYAARAAPPSATLNFSLLDKIKSSLSYFGKFLSNI